MTVKNIRADVVCDVCGLVAEACPLGAQPNTWVCIDNKWSNWEMHLCPGCYTAIDNRLFDIGQDITMPEGVSLQQVLRAWPFDRHQEKK